MANVIINDTHLNNIASAIREKNGKTTKYKPAEMATAISAIETESGSSEWQPQPDWWDIDTILENDTEDYAGKMIALLSDIYDITSIATRGANKIVTSDGKVYTPTSEDNISHSWDKIKDKDCSLGCKTRYIIWYYHESSDNNLSKSFSSNEGKIVLSVILKNFSNLNIGGDSWTDTNINLFNG